MRLGSLDSGTRMLPTGGKAAKGLMSAAPGEEPRPTAMVDRGAKLVLKPSRASVSVSVWPRSMKSGAQETDEFGRAATFH